MLDFSTWSPEAVAGVTLMALLLVVIIVVAFMCVQAGLFHVINIQTKKPEFGELVVMYKLGRGPYSGSGTLFTEAHSLLPQYNTIGVYYDDPEKKSSDNLRYIVGLVVAQDGASADAEHVALLESNGYKRVVLPAVQHAVVTDFPYCSTLSCIFAVFRVYPALREYVERRELCAHPYLELYDSSSQRILFMGPLELQDAFYVPDLGEDPASPDEDEGGSDEGDGEEEESEDGEEEEEKSCKDKKGEEEEGGEECLSNAEPSCVTESKDATSSSTHNWEQSASLMAEGASRSSKATDNVSSLTGAAEESDTNTGSSFEELDASETPTSDDLSSRGDAAPLH